jgi:hemoglobin-like flavoprotein
VLLPAVEKIAQKHTSLNIQPDQYAKQRFTLIAIALVIHVEDVFEFGMVRQHAVIKVGGS